MGDKNWNQVGWIDQNGPDGGGTHTVESVDYVCYGAGPDPTPVPGISGNLLRDGGMEQYPLSAYWFPDTASGAGDSFGRVNTSNLLQIGYGQPVCGKGFHIVGNTQLCGWSALEFYNINCARAMAPVRQRFNWPGGALHWSLQARGLPHQTDHQVPVHIWITNTSTNQQTSFVNAGVPSSWKKYSGSTASLPAGVYVVNMYKGAGAGEYDAFAIDQVYIGTSPAGDSTCSTDLIPAITATPTPNIGTPTPGAISANYIDNCGFGQGEKYWQFAKPKAYVLYELNNYAHIESGAPQPGIYQYFTWPGGNAFLSLKTRAPFSAYYRNILSGQTYQALSGQPPNWPGGWYTYKTTSSLPKGTYTLNLHFPQGAPYADYDDVVVTSGNYGTCDAPDNATPTALPTNTPNHTPTFYPTNTLRPSSTMLPSSTPYGGNATATPRPSYTPQPTYTPWPTYTPVTPTQPTNTARPPATNTPWPTYTPLPTYTMQPTPTMSDQQQTAGAPTYTPNPTFTPPPTVIPQPPPSYYQECKRPSSATDVAGWIEYNRCETLRFFSFSPNAVSTVAAMPTMAAQYEPWGTIGEMQQTMKDGQELWNSYDWENTGMPGTHELPNADFILTPDPNSPWWDGTIDLNHDEPTVSMECDAKITEIIGPYLSQGVCFIWNYLNMKGLIAWIQLIINVAAYANLGYYFYAAWISKVL